jgi:hypothetical protein
MDNRQLQEELKNCTLSLNPSFDKLKDLFKAERLLPFLDYYLSINEDKPNCYHSRLHTLVATLDAIEGVYNEWNDPIYIKSVMLAMLFHDSGHSCGKYTDKENIEKALQDIATGFEYKDVVSCIPDKEKADIFKHVNTLIASTRWPIAKHDTKDKEHPLVPIVRDADLMAAYQNKPEKMLLLTGLFNEMKYSQGVSNYSFVDQQGTFLNNIKWRSRWAYIKSMKRNYPQCVKRTIAELELHLHTKV